jgi:cyclic pyranopterin phosphate synthase
MKKLSHINDQGQASMVHVGEKQVTLRNAKARAIVFLGKSILQEMEGSELQLAKGSVFQTAILAGIMGAKQTGQLIPLCHPVGMDHCDLTIEVLDEELIQIICSVSVEAKTGIEMEALTGASVAALTVYDMCKAMSHNIVIKEVCLLEKSGGKKNYKRHED